MYDLPTNETKFHRSIIRAGLRRLQLSIYARHYSSFSKARMAGNRIKEHLPEAGHVRLLTLTDKQFNEMEIFSGKLKVGPEKPTPNVLIL